MIGSYFHSFLFSQVFGLYFVIMSIILLSRADYYKEMIANLKTLGIGSMMAASLALFIGLFLVVLHNIWVLQPRVLVTILCWLIVIKSVMWLCIPVRMLEMLQKMWAGKGHYYACVVMFLLGVFMMARGFYLFMQNPNAPHALLLS